MVGDDEKGPLKTKAAETFGLLLFTLELLAEFAHKVPKAAEMLECGRCLVKVLQIMKDSPAKLNRPTYNELIGIGGGG